MNQSLKVTLKVLAPVAIGVTVVSWMMHNEFSVEVWNSIDWNWRVIGCIALAWLFMLGRDFGMTWRFRVMTDRQLTWKQCWRVDMMCEFTSCVTPTSVGGSAVGMFYLRREGIDLGRATTLMMTTLFLDELFFITAMPLMIILIPYRELFGFGDSAFFTGLQTAFWIIYTALFLWTCLLCIGILLRPQWAIKLGNKLSKIKFLRKYEARINEFTQSMANTGKQLRSRPWKWWIETFGGTGLTWCSRYFVVCALFMAFAPVASQLVVFGRQLVVWIVLLVSPTPGGAGISEWLFTTYYGDLIDSASMALIIAMFWRIISYYIYLVVGIFIVPGWIRQGLKLKEQKKALRNKQNEINNPS